MRTDRSGKVLNVTEAWLLSGWGISRSGCTLVQAWNAWKCLSTNHRMLTIESMDPDHEIRRISPLALSSNDGFTDLYNGCMDKGWLAYFECMTFYLLDCCSSSDICVFSTFLQVFQLHLLKKIDDLLDYHSDK
jgi:hypothetical protein